MKIIDHKDAINRRLYNVDSIRPSFLAKYLTKDAISALISFCGGVAGALLPLLLAAKSDEEDSNNANSP